MVDLKILKDAISTVIELGGDFAEIFVEERTSSNISVANSEIENVVSGLSCGIGIRGFSGSKSVYAYTNDFSDEAILGAAKRVGTALKGLPDSNFKIDLRTFKNEDRHNIVIRPSDYPKDLKIKIIKDTLEGLKVYEETVKENSIVLADYVQKVQIANSDGLLADDTRTRVRLAVSAVASMNGQKETGFYGPGAAMGYEFFSFVDPFEVGKESARQADRMIRAEYAPAGKMPVVISNEFGGVIFHEACGHALEATSVSKGASVFCGKIGQKVASELVSAVDDGTIPHAWGSTNIDDEGTATRRNVLIENGILKGYMVDRMGARKMGTDYTGNSRRQDYTFAPTSRMTNTFILPGKSLPEEIISATEKGLYAKRLGGGSVDPSTGEFNFAVREGYMIENGRITTPVRGATLIGRGIEVLEKIDMVGNDLGRGQGMCGSISGSIPADVGQPTIRVSELVVGGRSR